MSETINLSLFRDSNVILLILFSIQDACHMFKVSARKGTASFLLPHKPIRWLLWNAEEEYNINTNKFTVVFWCSFIARVSSKLSRSLYVAILRKVWTTMQLELQECQNHSIIENTVITGLWVTEIHTLYTLYVQIYRCFTTLGHNCRRWFPRSLWSKKFI